MKVRLCQPSDATEIAEIYRPFCEKTSVVSFEIVAPDSAEMARRMEKITQRLPWLVADEASVVAGYAYASPHAERAAYRWSVNVTVYICERYRRHGVGRALYTSLFSLLRLQGYVTAYAGITVPNPGSTGLHSAMGFKLVGTYRNVGYKSGAWRDVVWMDLPLQPPPATPAEPRPFSEISTLPEVQAALELGEKAFASRSP
jgi:phosphinothricin acetyltransferase